MKLKILILLLILSSLFGYLEWSGNSQSFLFEAEGEILYKLFTDPNSVVHPFILLPLFGQLLLLAASFRKKPPVLWIYTGMTGLTLLLGFMFAIGILSSNFKILFSTVPFLIISAGVIYEIRKQNQIGNKA